MAKSIAMRSMLLLARWWMIDQSSKAFIGNVINSYTKVTGLVAMQIFNKSLSAVLAIITTWMITCL